MPRRRMIDPSIWDDEGVGSLSDSAFRLFVACISYADDYGRLEGSSRKLRAIAFRFRNKSSPRIDKLLSEIEANIRGFHRYSVDGREFIALLNWRKYQRVDKPQSSSLPDPPDPPDAPAFVERSKNDPGTISDHSSHEGKVIEGEGEGEAICSLSLCKLFGQLNAKDPSINDRKLEAQLRLRDDFRNHVAMTALELCHAAAKEREGKGWTAGSLKYYEKAVLKALEQGVMPGQAKGGVDGVYWRDLDINDQQCLEDGIPIEKYKGKRLIGAPEGVHT